MTQPPASEAKWQEPQGNSSSLGEDHDSGLPFLLPSALQRPSGCCLLEGGDRRSPSSVGALPLFGRLQQQDHSTMTSNSPGLLQSGSWSESSPIRHTHLLRAASVPYWSNTIHTCWCSSDPPEDGSSVSGKGLMAEERKFVFSRVLGVDGSQSWGRDQDLTSDGTTTWTSCSEISIPTPQYFIEVISPFNMLFLV